MKLFRHPAGVTMGAALLLIVSPVSPGQQADAKRARKPVALVKTDTEVDAALAEAKLALEQNRPADAIKLYQTLVEQSGELLYATEAGLYAPVAVAVRAALRQLPPPVAELYRQTYEPIAQAKFTEASAAFDAVALRALAARWPLTESAARALERAGAIAFDRGDFARAAECWQQLWREKQASWSREDAARLQTQLIIALTEAGRATEAEQCRKELREKFPNAKAKLGDEEVEVEKFLEKYFADRHPPSEIRNPPLTDWPMLGGDLTGARLMSDAEPILDPQWVHETGEKSQPMDLSQYRRSGNFVFWNGRWVDARAIPQTPDSSFPLYPAVADLAGAQASPLERLAQAHVIVRSRQRIGCLDLAGGRLLWQTEAAMGVGGSGVDENGNPWMANDDALSVSVADGLVYSVENFGFDPMMMQRGGARPDKYAMSSTLAARDLRGGKLVWRVGRGQGGSVPILKDVPLVGRLFRAGATPSEGNNEFVKSARYVSLPTVVEGRAFVLAIYTQAFYLVCLDARDGSFHWKTFISQKPLDQAMMWGVTAAEAVSPPVVEGGRIFCATEAGVIACADADTGQILWARQYATNAPDLEAPQRGQWTPTAHFPLNRPLVRDGVLYALPSDASEVLALQAASGKIRWQKPREGQRYLVGLSSSGDKQTSALILAASHAEAIRASDGERLWTSTRRDFFARPALTRDYLYLSAGKDGIVRLSLNDGAVDKIFPPISPDAALGNLLSVGGVVLAATDNKVAAYFDYATSYDIASRRIADYPAAPEFHRLRGLISLKANKPRAALDDLLQGWQVLSADTTSQARADWAATIFSAHLAEGVAERGKLKASFEAAAPFAVTPEMRTELAVRWARYHEQRGGASEALAALQSILLEDAELSLALPNFEAEEQGRLAAGFRKGEVSNTQFAAQEIARLIAQHGRGIYAKFEQAARAAETDAAAKADVVALLQVTSRYPNSEAAELARLDVAQLKFSRQEGEAAADALLELANRRRSLHAAEALVALAICREKQGATELAESAVRRLASVLAENPRAESARVSFGGYSGSVKDFLSARAAALGVDLKSLAQASSSARDFALPLARVGGLEQSFLLLDRAGGVPLVAGDSVFVVTGDKLKRMELPSRRVLWEAVGEFGMMWERATAAAPNQPRPASKWAAVIAGSPAEGGQALVIADGKQIYAIDLASGRRLWAEPCPEHFKVAGVLAASRDAAGEGIVICLRQADSLVAFGARTGVKKWDVALSVASSQVVQPNFLQMTGGQIVVAQTKPARFWAVEAASGKLTADVEMKGDLSQEPMVSPTGALVAAGEAGLSAFDIRSGKKLWEVTTLGLRPRLLGVDEQAVYATGVSRGTELAVISLASGKLLWKVGLSIGNRPILPLLLQTASDGGQVFVFGVEPQGNQQINLFQARGGFIATGEDTQARGAKVLALNAANGQLLWAHEPPSLKVGVDELQVLAQGMVLRLQAQGQGVVLPAESQPFWLTESQALMLDGIEGTKQVFTVRDRFNGKILQQLELEAVVTEIQGEAAKAPAGLRVIRGGGAVSNIVSPAIPTRAALAGGALILQNGSELIVLQKEGATGKNERPAR